MHVIFELFVEARSDQSSYNKAKGGIKKYES